MGCTTSTEVYNIEKTLGPTEEMILAGEKEYTLPDEDWQEESKLTWPFDLGRLQKINYKKIIKEERPWKDKLFPPDDSSLFIDGKAHADSSIFMKKRVWNEYEWMRISKFYEDSIQTKKFCIFDKIEPEDVKQGNLANTTLMATLSGIAERDMNAEETETSLAGASVRDMFLTQTVNGAGCYAVKFCINGLDKIVVVDDYFPFKMSKKGDHKFAFASSSTGENEIWMMIVEKAWAKVCGSYEATEHTTIEEAFEVLAGGPTQTYDVEHYKLDIRRAGNAREERVDKLWKILHEGNQKGWVTTVQSEPMPHDTDVIRDEDAIRWASIENKGIKYSHTYTVLDTKLVTLKNDYTDLLILLRNPSNKNNRGQQWKGDWNPQCDLWTKHTKQQVGSISRNMTKAQFWMSLTDLLAMFRYITINHSDPTFSRRIIPCEIPRQEIGEGIKPDERANWGIIKIRITKHAESAFFRLFQLHGRFATVEPDGLTGNIPKWKDPEMVMIIIKKAKIPPRGKVDKCTTEYAFLEGTRAKSNMIGCRVNGLRGGDYMVLYKVAFKDHHKVRKLNLRFSTTEDTVEEAIVSRITPQSYKLEFFKRMEYRLHVRMLLQGHYDQPVV